MNSKDTLDYIIYSKHPSENGSDDYDVLGISSGLTPQDAKILRGLASVEPVGSSIGNASLAVGVFKGPDQDSILAWARNERTNGEVKPIYRYIVVPREVLQAMSNHMDYFIDTTLHMPPATSHNTPLKPLDVPNLPTWTADKQIALFDRLLSEYVHGDMDIAFRLLAAALDEHRLLIVGFEPSLRKRLEFVQGLMMLLPSSVRSALTFSTNVKSVGTHMGRIIFGDMPDDTENVTRHIADWAKGIIPDDQMLEMPYTQLLKMIWNGDMQTFTMELRTLETIAHELMPGKHLHDGLDAVTRRYLLNKHVLSGEEVSGEELKAALQEGTVPAGALHDRYVECLLDYCLNERDTQAVPIITPYLEETTELSERLKNKLTQMLDTEPDAVYFFVRTRLAEMLDTAWLPLLHSAAMFSLKVAITDGDAETLMNWFRLISREPAGYELETIFYDGIIAAKQRARHDGELASRLLLFTAKRAPHLIDDLLNDAALVATLPAPLGPALREYDFESVLETIELGREISLVMLSRAAQDARQNDAAAAVFTSEQISLLWELHHNASCEHLPDHYQPVYVIDTLIADGVDRLAPAAVETLLTHIVTSDQIDLFRQISAQLTEHYQLHELLITIYQNTNLEAERILVLTNHLVVDETLTEQQGIDLYRRVAASRDWDIQVLPLVEQIARSIQRNPELNVPMDILWRMLVIAGESKTELVARVVTRRILLQVGESKDENQPVDTLLRLHERLQWNSSVYGYVINWLREYAKKQSISRLQQLKKALEGKRPLEDAYAIVETAIAVRKMMGNRTLAEFAQDINTSYAILQALSDAFDPLNRQPIDFDPLTARAELDSDTEALSPDERSVLAKNLKELAQLVITMSEHRRKATLIRSEENIERQLFTGEQHPQSAIDTMKWLSGYLNGAQDKGKQDE